MTEPKSAEPLIVRTFMTHAMEDADILALSTGRDDEFRRIMDAIERSRRAAPGSLQHVVLYGSRGFGKSFMTRRIQIAVAGLDCALGPVLCVLLPEEQHNLQRSPHAFLEIITLQINALEGEGDEGYEAALFRWPKPGEAARRWNEAAAELDAAVAAALADGNGLVLVVVENFDILIATLFREAEDEQRLRQWLDRNNNRIMVLATATGTIDVDYERPLFKAFEPVRLSPWTADDCIAYFNRQRTREGREPLTPEQQGKAKAIAEFIGGTPRLAQLLAEVIDTQDALTVVETMSALADKLAEYYRRRIEDLAPLGRGLLDALIRGGEPASQTALAARVGADGQSTIARLMDELQRADIVRGQSARDGPDKLYSVTDRVFVHYYRLRQGSHKAKTTPLATILDFLKSFYTREEQRAQALHHLAAGRPAEAALFSRLAMDGAPTRDSAYTRDFAYRLEQYRDAAPDALKMHAAAMMALVSTEPERAYDHCRQVQCDTIAAAVIIDVVKAQASYRLGHTGEARRILEKAVDTAGNDAAAATIANCELISFSYWTGTDARICAEIGLRLQAITPQISLTRLTTRQSILIAWSLNQLGHHGEAIETAQRAVGLAQAAKDAHGEALLLRFIGFSLGALGRHQEAIQSAGRAAALARQIGDEAEEALSLRHMAFSLDELGRHQHALVPVRRAAELARKAGDKAGEAQSLRLMACSLAALDRHEEAVRYSGLAAKLAGEASDKFEEAESLRHMAFSLNRLGRHDEAQAQAKASLDLARKEGDRYNFSRAVREGMVAATTVTWPEVVAVYGEWVEAFRARHGNVADPTAWLRELFIAAARASAFAALDGMLEQHGAWLAEYTSRFSLFSPAGETLARIAEADGRAAAYEAAAGLLPRIAAFMARLPAERRDRTWLPDLITGFAAACSDAGLLRDVSLLLTPALAADAEASAVLLRRFADLDEAPDAAAALARTDPDVALLYRRLRGLFDPPPPPPKRKKKRPRSLRGTG